MNPTADEEWLKLGDRPDLNNCDREPIHAPSSIQSHGALGVLDRDGNVVQKSDNFLAFIKPFGGLPSLGARLEEPDFLGLIGPEPRFGTWGEGDDLCSIVVSRSDTQTIVELESISAGPGGELLSTVAEAIDAIENVSVGRAFELLCTAIRSITGFHRVMAYQMEPNGHGVVVAEATADPAPRFLGLHFPATDIPKQARRLYVIERTRIIADVNDEPIPIRPQINPVTGRPLNMSRCQTRTVSPIHIQYLKNMGVGASFSASVVVEGELAALFACHHPTGRLLSPAARQACGLLSRAMSQLVQRRKAESTELSRSRVLSAQIDLLARLGDAAVLGVDSSAWEASMELMGCDGVLVRIGDNTNTFGNVDPHSEALFAIADRLSVAAKNHASALGALDPRVAGGMLAIPVADRGVLAWYRAPRDHTIVWGGEPEDSAGDSLTPRASFAAFTELVKGTSVAFHDGDVQVASVVKRGLSVRLNIPAEPSKDDFEQALSQLREQVTYLEQAHQRQRLINQDLRQFARAASHDLKAPVRTIRSFLPLISEEALPALSKDGREWFEFVSSAADTLARLQAGVWAFSQVSRATIFESVDLASIVRRLIQSHAANLGDASVTIGTLPTLRVVPDQVEVLMSNLIENATKYRSAERPLRLVIDSSPTRDGHVFTVSDNGIGFPPAQSERLFELFARLHPGHADGDGLGLALCRRIVHHHGGEIQAISEHQGTTIRFSLSHHAGLVS